MPRWKAFRCQSGEEEEKLAKHLGKRATPPARVRFTPRDMLARSSSTLPPLDFFSPTACRSVSTLSRATLCFRRSGVSGVRSRGAPGESKLVSFPRAKFRRVSTALRRICRYTYTCVRARCRCRNASHSLYEYLKFRDDTSRARARVHGGARRENISICRCQRSAAARDYRSLSRGARGSRCKCRSASAIYGSAIYDPAIPLLATPRAAIFMGKIISR